MKTHFTNEIQGTYHKQPKQWPWYLVSAIVFIWLALYLADQVLGAETVTNLIAGLWTL